MAEPKKPLSMPDLIVREVERYVPAYVARISNAAVEIVTCNRLNMSFINDKIPVLIYKDKVAKVICEHISKDKKCLYDKKKRGCYIWHT